MPGWVIPLSGLLGATPWVLVTIRALRRVGRGDHAPEPARIATLATLAVVGTCLTVSALVYVDLIATDLSRLMVSTARVALIIGGWYVLWAGRRVEGA